jgi:hypothetical protein
MRMPVCYLDCHEAGLCCYLVIPIENVLRPLQLFYFHLWPIYWLSLVLHISNDTIIDEWWIGKDFNRSGHDLNRDNFVIFICIYWEKLRNTSFRICVPAEIRTKHLPHKIQSVTARLTRLTILDLINPIIFGCFKKYNSVLQLPLLLFCATGSRNDGSGSQWLRG